MTHARTGPGSLAKRIIGAALPALVITALLGALIVLQPPAASATPQAVTPRAASADLPSVAPAPPSMAHLGNRIEQSPLAAGPLKMGCLGPDALCDIAGDAGECVTSPVDCAKDTAGDVKEGVGDKLEGVKDCATNPSLSGCLKGLGGVVPNPVTGGCGILDVICDKVPGTGDVLPGLAGVPGLPGLGGLGASIPGLDGIPDPLGGLGDIIAKAAADAWTAAMLAIWSAGLFVLRIILSLAEIFLTPDLRSSGPGKDVYSYTLWGALVLVTIMTVVQLGVAAFKREGKSLARAVIGSGQFIFAVSIWFGGCALVVAACGAITKALMKALLNVNTWSGWDPLGGFDTQSITDGTVATVLGLLGLVLWLAALGHLLIYLARAAALLILTATGPLAAAGLVSDAGRSWFWKSLRWFIAAAFTPVIMVLVLGIGVQMANGVAAHLAEDSAKAIGTALPSVMLICISAVAPLSLFKLLAFVDPGTPSGASFRQGLAMQGGIQGLLTGNGGSSGGGSTAASQADSNGRSAGEQGAEDSTSGRFNGATKGALGALGPVGAGLAAGMGVMQSIGAKGTSLMADESNQAGVGHQTYGPDFSGASSNGQGTGSKNGTHPASQNTDDDYDNDGDDDTTPPTPPPTLPTPPTAPQPPGGQGAGQGGGAGAGTKPAGGAPGGAGGGAAGGAAGATPPPVA